MSNVRDELQQWVDGVDATHEDGLADLNHDVIPVDLARRVLAEMDAALAILAEVRAEHQPKSEPCCDCSRICVPCALECTACGTQWPCTTSAILDRSTP